MATAFHTQAPMLAPRPRLVPEIGRRPSDARLLADMLDVLAECVTEPQLHAWLSATAEFRARLPELLLIRAERERERQERRIALSQRKTLIAERVERARLAKIGLRRQDGYRSPLLVAIRQACLRHKLSDVTFGRQALGDPCLVRDLLSGRTPRQATEARIHAFIASLDGEAANA